MIIAAVVAVADWWLVAALMKDLDSAGSGSLCRAELYLGTFLA